MIKKITLLVLIMFFGFIQLFAQAPDSYNAADIEWQLQKLQVLGSVLYIGAHPDDENNRLLTYLSREKKYRTAYLSLTRGDGGQNLIGDEQGVALGLIRTQELLAARRVDGAGQFFTRAYDFGFSKNPQETFKVWDKEKILSDVVWVIRYFRPDIIITRFPEDGRAGHGHHSASAILAREAFYAAADAMRFPEQLQSDGLKTWQAKRLLWNNFNFGSLNTTREDQFKIDAGGYNAMLGKSNGEIAAASRSQHKSQGFGVAATRGIAYEYFTPVAGDAPVKDLMDGVDVTWNRINDEGAAEMIDGIIDRYKVSLPEKSLADLLQLLRYLSSIRDRSTWVSEKIKELNRIVLASMGMYFEATTHQQFAVTDDSLAVTFTVINRSHFPLKKVVINYADSSFSLTDSFPYNVPRTISHKHLVRSSYDDGQPYWLREQMTEGGFNLQSQRVLAFPDNPKNDVTVSYFADDTTSFTSQHAIQYRYTDPVKGELYEPVIIIPPLLINTSPAVVLTKVVPKADSRITVHYEIKGAKPVNNSFITFEGTPKSKTYPIAPSSARSGDVVFDPDTLLRTGANLDISPGITVREQGHSVTYGNYIRVIQYDHIPTVHYLFHPKTKVIGEAVKTIGKRIGYIRGAGDHVPEALQAMGYDVVMLGESDLVPSRLAGLDAIITGVRAYNVHSFLQAKYPVLMNYVKKGGNLIVQYNTSNFGSIDKPAIGPYPFTITNKRVTNEKAHVNFLLPRHPVLNYPNKIGEKDFDNWIQERGIYFGDKPDPAFQMPLSMADPGEDEQKGSLLIASYGKGNFVYTGLVFFRELPAGVPGAYRLMANIIALNKKKGSK